MTGNSPFDDRIESWAAEFAGSPEAAPFPPRVRERSQSRPSWRAAALVAFVFIGSHVAGGCGKDFSTAGSSRQLTRLPTTSTVVRARGLRDAEVPVLSRFEDLQYLDLGAGVAAVPQRLTSAGFEALARLRLRRLKWVYVSCSASVDDEALRSLAKIESLQSLSVRRCETITDAGVRAVATMANLEFLDLRGCVGVTDASVESLATMKHLSQPRALGVTGTSISESGIQRLRAALGPRVVDADDGYWAAEDPATHGVATD